VRQIGQTVLLHLKEKEGATLPMEEFFFFFLGGGVFVQVQCVCNSRADKAYS
jgi:hypothetical protein